MALLLVLGLAGLIVARPFVPREATVELVTFQFSPDTARVAAGDLVRWTNRDQIAHTVTGGTPDRPAADWSAVLAAVGSTTSRRFDQAGTYSYFCDRHQFMRGAVIVTPNR
jgi:plastocyanin